MFPSLGYFHSWSLATLLPLPYATLSSFASVSTPSPPDAKQTRIFLKKHAQDAFRFTDIRIPLVGIHIMYLHLRNIPTHTYSYTYIITICICAYTTRLALFYLCAKRRPKFFHIAESNEFFMRSRRGCEKAYENLRRKHTPPSFGDLIIATAPLSPAAPEKRAAYRRVSAKIYRHSFFLFHVRAAAAGVKYKIREINRPRRRGEGGNTERTKIFTRKREMNSWYRIYAAPHPLPNRKKYRVIRIRRGCVWFSWSTFVITFK